ncbi:toll/interleukin-1 receptor domain-containing protein [Paraburkholderia acidisoli]|uniref:TIR domain-containing protein n=1 Tax=Paraburkholderia acidisoli TaxID=2571748 RepID=A0A7Z2JDV6_9BURK|nr:toll/interleukin-1 receptor domain-containing protein [Paraburkholderia acidisoli]QGZ61642.1 TIR domain-containing protein [Paraburkholderia acidisoli]
MSSQPLLFVSHIHEESELAVILQTALRKEFSGFVEVFVSSDGASINAGAHFLEAVEGALTRCVGALYLISPKSVTRPWVNFELGAMWIRGAVSKANGGARLTALPVCHSGAKPSALPAPLNVLNGIRANEASGLEFAFRSLQKALGVNADLRTDFNELAEEIRKFEAKYTLGEVLRERFAACMTKEQRFTLVTACRSAAAKPNPSFALELPNIESSEAEKWRQSIAGPLAGKIRIEHKGGGVTFGTATSFNHVHVVLHFDSNLVVDHAELIAN